MNPDKSIYTVNNNTISISILLGLGAIAYGFITGNYIISLGLIALPIFTIIAIQCFRNPIITFLFLFICNYYVLALTRYINYSGSSYLMDFLGVFCLLTIIIQSHHYHNFNWGIIRHNYFLLGMFVWMVYCFLLIANPSGMIKAWISSRGVAYNGVIISLLASLLYTKLKAIKLTLFVLSILTLTAILKVLQQKFFGWDPFEYQWLQNGGAVTHIIGSGIRYFSFYTDAGNFGSNMGCACVIFILAGIYIRNNILLKIYYLIIGVLSLYALFLSGTRGAIVVPLAAGAFYIMISRNIKIMLAGAFFLFLFYVFFAFTNIGQSNTQIRRMRTAFTPSEDASFNVRRNNQRKLATYLANKPFGEGLGLSGVENQKNSRRFTTEIPNDSWYVKIWVETGVVGITLYLIIMFGSFALAGWTLFKIKDKETKGILSGILCGIFGLFISAYGNAFWGQYPTNIIACWGISIIFNAKIIESDLNNQTNNTNAICC